MSSETPKITALSSSPPFITPEQYAELQQSTPERFDANPPVLRLKVDGVKVEVDPPFDSLEGAEGVAWTDGTGQLWLTEGALSFWLPALSRGFSLPYPLISLHAISRSPPPVSSPSSEAKPCIYCQLDETGGVEGEGAEGEEEGEEGSTNTMREVRLIPEREDQLDAMFEALSYCASLHPSLGGPVDNPFAMGLGGTGDGDGWVFSDQMEDAEEGDGDEDARWNAEGDEREAFGGDEQELSEVGRVRSDFVNPDARFRPY